MAHLLVLPIGALFISAVAIVYPRLLDGYASAIVPLLTFIMFSMGMTLKLTDFERVIKMPLLILLGVSMQYLLMPLLGWLLGIGFGFSSSIAAGIILVGACPGGTASNVICYLARGNVALSITLTAVSTIIATIATPLMTYLYVAQDITVSVDGMMKSLFYIVLLPVTMGVVINSYWHKKIERVSHVLPYVSMCSIILIIGVIVAISHEKLNEIGVVIIIAVILHNLTGLLLGYLIPRLLRYDESVCRTLAIEVGMQNSGLAVALANKFLTPLAALPAAFFSIWHNISGSMLAAWWSKDKA